MKKLILLTTGLLMVVIVLVLAQNKKEAAKKVTKEKDRIVQITTDLGTMKVRLYNATPKHRDNFIKLVKEGFYDSLLFHRVIRGFMIQGGDPDSKHAKSGQMLGMGANGYTIPAEFNDTLFHKKGALAAARMGDEVNPKKESSGCQFYIVHGTGPIGLPQLEMFEKQTGMKFSESQKKAYTTTGGAPHLDKNYTVYGEVIEGMDVIDKIANSQTAPGDRPVQDIRMKMKIVQ